jgi:hypothetical protein
LLYPAFRRQREDGAQPKSQPTTRGYLVREFCAEFPKKSTPAVQKSKDLGLRPRAFTSSCGSIRL